MKIVTGHADYIALVVAHFAYTICTGVLANTVSMNYGEFITKLMCAAMATRRELFAGILSTVGESLLKRMDSHNDSIKNAVSTVIKIVMVVLTIFITVLDTGNIYVIIIPMVNLVNVYFMRLLQKKESSTSDLSFTNMNSNWCPHCDGICCGKCQIIADFKKSIWTQTKLITVTWLPDIICIVFFEYSGSTSAVIISYMYVSWMIRDTISYSFKVMDDKAQPVRLIQDMISFYSTMSKNQVSLNKDGVVLGDVKNLVVKEYICQSGESFSRTFERLTIGGGLNGSGKTVMTQRMLIGAEPFSVILTDGTEVKLSVCSLKSIRNKIRRYTPKTPLPSDLKRFYDESESVANMLGITRKMAESDRLSDGQKCLFIFMLAIISKCKGVIILDEVTAYIDTTKYDSIIEVLTRECDDCVVIIINNALPPEKCQFYLPGPSK
jgi:ABC-type multidrug transport system fused ATPase/permease subunit